MLDILKDTIPEKDLQNIVIQSGGNPKSKVIFGVSGPQITPLTKKLDKTIVDGSMIHCKPRVPLTPPQEKNSKPTDAKTTTEEKINNVEENNSKEKEKVLRFRD